MFFEIRNRTNSEAQAGNTDRVLLKLKGNLRFLRFLGVNKTTEETKGTKIFRILLSFWRLGCQAVFLLWSPWVATAGRDASPTLSKAVIHSRVFTALENGL